MRKTFRGSRRKTPKRKQAELAQSPAWYIFTPDPEKLRPGDVLLERAPTFISRSIRLIDRGEYSHALIFLGPLDFLEAVGGYGARVISFARVPIERPSDWILLRHPDELISHAAATKARSLAHKKYGKLAAVKSKLLPKPKSNPTRLFCSQLVAEAYARAGAPLVKGKTPSSITPRLLHKNSALKPQKEVPLLKIAVRGKPMFDRDAGYAGALTARELRAFQRVFDAVRPELNRIYETNDVIPSPGNVPELIHFLVWAENEGHAQTVASAMKAFEQALVDVKYFDLYSQFAKEVELAISLDVALAKSDGATTDDRKLLAHQLRL